MIITGDCQSVKMVDQYGNMGEGKTAKEAMDDYNESTMKRMESEADNLVMLDEMLP